MGKKVKKIFSKPKSIFSGGGSSSKDDNSAAIYAQQQAEREALARQQAEREALALQKQQALDAQTDLGLGQDANVFEGEAAAVSAEGDTTKRKRKGAGSLSEALGLGGL